MSKPWLRKLTCKRCEHPFEAFCSRKRLYDDACLAIRKSEHSKVIGLSQSHKIRLVGLSNKGKIGLRDEAHPFWKGNDVGLDSLHSWVIRRLGKPQLCEHCGAKNARMEWSNKSQLYKRELTDWQRLCRSCHLKYDNKMGVRNGNRKALT